jgi:diguanylate cyclase (GGDEF)-like protein
MSLLSLLNDPKHWQHRAAQARALADRLTDVVGKATALSIANDYARLAKRAEDRQLARPDNPSLIEVETRPEDQEAIGAPLSQRRSSGRLIMPTSYLVVCSIIGIVTYLVNWSYGDAWAKARRGAENVARALQTDIARNIDLYDDALQGVQDAIQSIPKAGDIAHERELILGIVARAFRQIGALRILDADGNVVASSGGTAEADTNFGDPNYFQVHRQGRDVGLYISGPFKDRLGHGGDSIALSRRLSDREGTFAGVVVAVLPLAYFRDLFQQIDVGSRGVITLISSNGTILVRQPSLTSAGDAGVRLDQSPNFQRMLEEKSGFFSAPFATDGVNRLRAFRQIDDLPLIVSVNPAVGDIYREWCQRATWAVVITLLVCAGILAISARFRRELYRREMAESDLAALAIELSALATTDGLTGLTNRRAFDIVLRREWRRAARTDSSLALLMIDVDQFKPFNDRYGHIRGDDVLRILAEAISDSARRPGDRGSRYGGEEFAIILPDTDAAGARSVAERLRGRFLTRGQEHGIDFPLPTLSIGISAAKPRMASGEMDLVRTADLALYKAKENGRDRVEAAAESASAGQAPSISKSV